MNQKIKVNSKCRMCNAARLVKFLDLGDMPLANDFLTKQEISKPQELYPLEVYFCPACNLVQLGHVVNRKNLFCDYIYFPSKINELSAHFRTYAKDVQSRFLKDPQSFVVEIGSNDGLLLAFIQNSPCKVLGIDPAINIAAVARKRGVETVAEFFSEELAKDISSRYGRANVILANNVVAHIDDLDDLARGIDSLLNAKGVFIFEAPYLVDMFENLTYDTIYHEHLSYLSVIPLVKFFKKFDLEIFDIKPYNVQGLSIRVFVGKRGQHPKTSSVGSFLRKEKKMGLDKPAAYIHLAKAIEQSRSRLRDILYMSRENGKSIVAYGAPAKGNTLLNYCQIGTDIIDYAIDRMPSKHGLYTPGMHIPVYSHERAKQQPPDYFLLLSWNYAADILEDEKEYRANGGKFIIPTGNISIV